MTDQPTDTEVREWLDAAAQHDALMAVARERWPEMVEEPKIVDASPGSRSLRIPYLEPEPVQWFEHDDPNWMPMEKLERILAGHPTRLFSYENIELEDVGAYRLGYGPRSGVLYVGADD